MPRSSPPSRPFAREAIPDRAHARRLARAASAAGASGRSVLAARLARTRRMLAAAGAELATAHAVTRATLESATEAILVTDAQGRVTDFNAKFLQIWGLRQHQVASARHADLAQLSAHRLREPQRVLERLVQIHAAAPAQETVDVLEMVDGRVFERASSVQHIDGCGVGRVWSYRDITVRRAAEDALRDEAGVLHFLNRTGATIAATLDIATLLQTVIDTATHVSGAACGAFFYRDDQARPAQGDDGEDASLQALVAAAARQAAGTPMLALAGAAPGASEQFDSLRTAALFGAAWGDGKAVCIADVTAQDAYGATATRFGLAEGDAPVRSFLAVPVTLRSGATVGGLFFGHPEVGVFTERSQRIVAGIATHAAIALDNARLVEDMRRAAVERERLVQAERAARTEAAHAAHIKDEFLSVLSHELRTPLTAILGWAKVLLLQRSDAPTRQRGLQAIERNAAAQAALIEDLLDMSRIVSGKVAIERRAADLRAVVDAALSAAAATADAKHIDLRRRIDPAACTVAGDAARLQQVVANLVSNAIKFTPEHGQVTVSLTRVGAEVELEVADTGVGIAPEFLPHVFDHFRQADSSTTRRHGGLGLGLAIVRQLVGLHGGAVSARSDGPDRGARFIVRLPCGGPGDGASDSAARADAAVAPSAAFCDVDLHGLRLLVVDDEDDARELIAQLLIECGAEVCQAASAAQALREFERAPPDVLLSDIGMPGRDGYELMRDVRAFDAGHGGDVPAVALTAFSRSEDRAQAMLAGYQAHIAKPIEPRVLVATVAGLAGRGTGRRARDAVTSDS